MAIPYFHHAALSDCFTQDIQAALTAARIDDTQRQWLQRLVDVPDLLPDSPPLPRVDRLLIDDSTPDHADLACAWVITDSQVSTAPVFLSSVLTGIERFTDRAALIDTLRQRFSLTDQVLSGLEVERIEGALFEQRMLVILKQQSHHLDSLFDQLHELPSLHKALGHTLQAQLAHKGVVADIDVFSHLLQIVTVTAPGKPEVTEHVSGTQTLAEAAFDLFNARQLNEGLHKRFLGPQGQSLTQDQTTVYVQALADTPSALPAVYEQLLSEYWQYSAADGISRRDKMARALAESLRQALLHGRADGSLSLSEYRVLSGLPDAGLVSLSDGAIVLERIALQVAGQDPVKLAGMILIGFEVEQTPRLFLYSTSHGLRRLQSQQSLIDQLSGDNDPFERLCHTSLNDHFIVQMKGERSLHLEPLDSGWALMCMDTVIALQKRNLLHVLTLPTISPLHSPVRVDDALDLRALIDRRLLALHDPGRWRAGLWAFAQIWSAHPLPAQAPAPYAMEHPTEVADDVVQENAGSWFDEVQKLEWLIERQSQLHEGPAGCIRHALNRYLAVCGYAPIDARDLSVRYIDDRQQALLDVALERVSGFNLQPLELGSRIDTQSLNSDSIKAVEGLPLGLIEQMLVLIQSDFSTLYERHLQRFHSRALRWLDIHADPAALAVITRERALRFELAIDQRLERSEVDIKDMLGKVLNRPVRALRLLQDDQHLEVYSLSSRTAANLPAVVWSNSVLIRAASGQGRIAVWSVYTGLQGYDSMDELQQRFNYRLRNFEWFEHWQELLSPADRLILRRYLEDPDSPPLQLQLQRVDGHFIHALQQTEFERNRLYVMDMLNSTEKWHLDALMMCNALGMSERYDMNRQQLNNVATLLDSLLSELSLPDWIRTGSVQDLITLSWLVQHFFRAIEAHEDYLFGIAELHDYAREQLTSQLKLDYPELKLDPDQIIVTSTFYTPALVSLGQIPSAIAAATHRISETLTEFAINRFFDAQEGVLTLSTPQGQPFNDVLKGSALKKWVRSLDIGAHYRTLLQLKLSAGSADFLLRQRLFCEQMPLSEMLKALKLKMSGLLSAQAFAFICAVMKMPDALARLPASGLEVMISPLQLWAQDQGMTADPVTGAYVIAPLEPDRGPWILYLILYEGFVFKEYSSRSALLAALHTDTQLQAFILGRVDSDARKIYDNGGFTEPHVPFSTESALEVPWRTPAPVSIKVTPFQGSAALLLFDGTVQTLRLLARQQSLTTRESDRLSSQHLLTLGAEQLLALLPGRLGFLVAVWQSKDLFKESLQSGNEKQWGKALAEFITALAMLLSGREAAQLQSGPYGVPDSKPGPEPEPEPEIIDEPIAFPVFQWNNNGLTPELRNRLRAFEVRDVVLNSLKKDSAYNVYQDPVTGKRYAAVEGLVYQVLFSAESSFIIADERIGPRIALDKQLQWRLDLNGGLRGGGGGVSRIRKALVDNEIDRVMLVQASGMPEIRQKFRVKSQYIAQAHEQARRYLENSLDNLTPDSATGRREPRTRKVIADFFGVDEPDSALYDAVGETVKRLYQSLMDNALSPYHSSRYVIGINKVGHDDALAFTFDSDTQKRIFLTEKFFQVPSFRLKTRVWRQGSFNYGNHHRAVILLHELSHLYCDTDDIAYLDANAPFVDLLEDATAFRKRVHDQIVAAQQRTLSHQTARGELFRQLNEGGWEDIRRRDGSAKRNILSITGKSTLEQARDVFYENPQKRSEIILKNADSVALLISLLGRERFAT